MKDKLCFSLIFQSKNNFCQWRNRLGFFTWLPWLEVSFGDFPTLSCDLYNTCFQQKANSNLGFGLSDFNITRYLGWIPRSQFFSLWDFLVKYRRYFISIRYLKSQYGNSYLKLICTSITWLYKRDIGTQLLRHENIGCGIESYDVIMMTSFMVSL